MRRMTRRTTSHYTLIIPSLPPHYTFITPSLHPRYPFITPPRPRHYPLMIPYVPHLAGPTTSSSSRYCTAVPQELALK